MKKIILTLAIFLIVGCGMKMGNTPTKKVESYINNYQTLDKSVLADIDDMLNDEEYSDEQRNKYREMIKRNYQKISYKVKDEKIDGDNAVVTVEINVIDYSKITNESNLYLSNNPNEFMNENNEYDKSLFNDYLLDKLDKAKDEVTYTLELELHKNNGDWELEPLDDVELSKINGTYNY